MSRWLPWTDLPVATPFTEQTLRETLDGGQSFRWSYDPENGYWQGSWNTELARLRLSARGTLQASVFGDASARKSLATYLRASFNWDAATDSLPHRSDAHLAAALAAYPGLRILKQPFPEAVLCFLCSATKQIPQIKIMCQRLAETLGTEITDGAHALPTFEQIAASDENTLRSLGLGFRAKNIKKTADRIAKQGGILEQIEAAPYADAKAALIEFPGIGEKIADCALLFGAAKLEAFPVDTWIIKVLEKRYHLTGFSPAQLAQFGRAHYGPLAGYAQQFIFSYERSQP